ncbi:MAG TPA: hypothetical protein DEQ09_04615, partial [Bacteroidales bacterium]|nr:hypothetical protein [Bacteroidales bacterium]
MINLIKNTYRSIINQRPYSFINILGLTIGLTCVILIILWIKAETSYDRFHKDHENLYRVNHILRTPKRMMNVGGINDPAGPEFKSKFPVIDDFLRFSPAQVNLKYQDDFHAVNMVYADSNFFSMLDFPLLSGKKKSCLSASDGIVISRSAATKIFGDQYPVNKIVEINNLKYVVCGVAHDPPVNSSIKFEAVALLSILENESYIGWDGGLTCQTLLKLIPGTDTEKLLDDIKEYLFEVVNERFIKSGFEIVPYLQPLKDIHLGSDTDFDFGDNGSWKRIISFAFVGLLILMTACFNFVNISTALSIKRSKEVSIRKIYGSGRKRLIIFFITESGLSILISLFLSLLLAKAIFQYFNILVGSELNFSMITGLEWFIIIFLLWIVCVFLASFYSAWYLSAIPPMAILRIHTGGKRRQLSRNLLVTFQFTLSISLIISCLVIYSQMQFIRSTDPGFSDENVMYIGLSQQAAPRSEIIKERLLSVSGIRHISRTTGGMPGLNFTSNGYMVEGMDMPVMSNAVYVDKDYIQTMGIYLDEGRGFIDNKGDRFNVLVNNTFVNTVGWEEPIGKTIVRNNKEYKVIGIVKDFLTGSLHNKIQPLFISQFNEWGDFSVIILKLDASPTIDIKFQIEKIFTEEDPGNPINMVMLSESLRSQYDTERNLNIAFFVLSLLAILISVLGLFGLATFSSQSRKKEIGIRKVNGALVQDIIKRFSSELLIWILIAIAVATPLTILIMRNWLTNFEYKVGISIWLIIAGGLITLLIGILSISMATFREANR